MVRTYMQETAFLFLVSKGEVTYDTAVRLDVKLWCNVCFVLVRSQGDLFLITQYSESRYICMDGTFRSLEEMYFMNIILSTRGSELPLLKQVIIRDQTSTQHINITFECSPLLCPPFQSQIYYLSYLKRHGILMA